MQVIYQGDRFIHPTLGKFRFWVRFWDITIKDLNFIETKAQTHTKLSLLQQV